MNAFGFLKKLLRNKVVADTLACLGSNQSRTDEFIQSFAQSTIWVLGTGDNSEILTEVATQKELLDHIERGIQELQGMEKTDQTHIYEYSLEGHTILPIFSSMEMMQAYVQNMKLERVKTFQGLGIDSKVLLGAQFAAKRLVLNPETPYQRYLSSSDREALRLIIKG